MTSVKKNKFIIRFLLVVLAIVLSGSILAVSLIRTSLNTILKEENENELRTEPIEFLIPKMDGSLEKISYKLPGANILPTGVLYPLKKIRENLWIQFINNPIDKSKISLLIADKRISESIILIKYSKIELAFETIQEAIDKLKYSKEIIVNHKDNIIEIDQLKEQVFEAGFAYKKVLDNNRQFFEKTIKGNEEYKKLVKEIDFWNQIQTEERNAQKK